MKVDCVLDESVLRSMVEEISALLARYNDYPSMEVAVRAIDDKHNCINIRMVISFLSLIDETF